MIVYTNRAQHEYDKDCNASLTPNGCLIVTKPTPDIKTADEKEAMVAMYPTGEWVRVVAD